jgi:hypothetical protein
MLIGKVSLADLTSPVLSLARSRCAADASREVMERWLLDGSV